jgi:glutaredoxin
MKIHASVIALLFGFGVLFSITSPAQSLYKSVGPDGKITYSDRPPPEGRVEKTMRFNNLPGSTLTALAADRIEQLRQQKAGQQAAIQQGQTVIYTTSWCGYCKKAKAYLASKGISYQELDIETEPGLAAYAQAGGGGGVPLLLHRGERVQGFSVAAYDALFGKGR